TISLQAVANGTATIVFTADKVPVIRPDGSVVSIVPLVTGTLGVTVGTGGGTPTPTPTITTTVTPTPTGSTPTSTATVSATVTPSLTPLPPTPTLPSVGSMSFALSSATPTSDGQFNVDVKVDTGTKKVGGIQFEVKYTSSVASFQKIVAGPFLTTWAANP